MELLQGLQGLAFAVFAVLVPLVLCAVVIGATRYKTIGLLAGGAWLCVLVGGALVWGLMPLLLVLPYVGGVMALMVPLAWLFLHSRVSSYREAMMYASRSFGQLVGLVGLVVFEEKSSWGKAKGIITLSRPSSCLTDSTRGRDEGHSLREQGQIRRTQQSARGVSGSRRENSSRKLTAAHSGSTGLRVAEDQTVAVCYEPRAFENFEDVA